MNWHTEIRHAAQQQQVGKSDPEVSHLVDASTLAMNALPWRLCSSYDETAMPLLPFPIMPHLAVTWYRVAARCGRTSSL